MTESDYLKQPEMAGHLKVLEVLRRWDPIGVICEANQDEYDGYAVEFINRLDHRVPVPEIVDYMRGLVLGHMGMSTFDEAHARACATELAEFWQSWKDGTRSFNSIQSDHLLMAATATIARRAATADELAELRSTRGGLLGHMPLEMLLAAGIPFMVCALVPGVTGIIVGTVPAVAILVASWVDCRRSSRHMDQLVESEARRGEVEVITIDGAQPVSIPDDHSAFTPAFAFEISGGRTLVLVSQWLEDAASFGGTWDDIADPEGGEDYANGLPPPFAFPASSFTVHRFPESGYVVRIDIRGAYVAPVVHSDRVDLSALQGAESKVFECTMKELASAVRSLL